MKNIPLILFVIVLFAVIAILMAMLRQSKNEVARLSANQRTLLADAEFYRTKDSLSAASVERLQLTYREFEKYCTDLRLQVGELGIKVKRLQSVASAGIETKYDVITSIKDSIVFRDSTIMLKCLEINTPYLGVSGCAENNTFVGSIISRDTLDQIVHRVPHQFWFIKWGTKAIRQEVISRNPYSRITYSEYIELK